MNKCMNTSTLFEIIELRETVIKQTLQEYKIYVLNFQQLIERTVGLVE